MRWELFWLLVFLQIAITYPSFRATCEAREGWVRAGFIYGIHHLLDVFLFWSLFFLTAAAEFRTHFWLAILIVGHWFTYGNKCIITVDMNRQCGYPEERWLDSLKNRLGLRSLTEWFHFWWVGLLCVWDVWNGALN